MNKIDRKTALLFVIYVLFSFALTANYIPTDKLSEERQTVNIEMSRRSPSQSLLWQEKSSNAQPNYLADNFIGDEFYYLSGMENRLLGGSVIAYEPIEWQE